MISAAQASLRARLQAKADRLSCSIERVAALIRRERDAEVRRALVAVRHAALRDWARLDAEVQAIPLSTKDA